MAGLSSLGVPDVPWHTQILADQLTLFQPGGTDYVHLISTGTPRFSDLSTALKGQIKPKADWRFMDSPKIRTDEFGFFAMTVRKYLKHDISISSFKYFRTVMQKKNRLFAFWENLRRANLLTD